MELTSPDGSTTIIANPSRVDYLLSKGWTVSGEKKSAKAKTKVKVEEIQEPEEVQETEKAEEEES